MAERTAAELRQRMRQMESDMTTNERSTFDITAEMTRQYKAMQENLLQKITGLEAEIHRLKDELGTCSFLTLAGELSRGIYYRCVVLLFCAWNHIDTSLLVQRHRVPPLRRRVARKTSSSCGRTRSWSE